MCFYHIMHYHMHSVLHHTPCTLYHIMHCVFLPHHALCIFTSFYTLCIFTTLHNVFLPHYDITHCVFSDGGTPAVPARPAPARPAPPPPGARAPPAVPRPLAAESAGECVIYILPERCPRKSAPSLPPPTPSQLPHGLEFPLLYIQASCCGSTGQYFIYCWRGTPFPSVH